MMSRTISPAIISPAAAGTKEMLAGMLRRADSPSGRRGEGRGSSLEYSTFTREIPRFFNSRRMTRARGQTEVFAISVISNISGWSLLPVPMEAITGTHAALARAMISSLAETVSMASAM